MIAESQVQGCCAAGRSFVIYQPLPAVKNERKVRPQIHDLAPKNTIYEWSLGDAKAVHAAFSSAKHITKLDIVNNRLVPNAIEPRAALGRSTSTVAIS